MFDTPIAINSCVASTDFPLAVNNNKFHKNNRSTNFKKFDVGEIKVGPSNRSWSILNGRRTFHNFLRYLPKALQIAISSIREMSGITMMPLPRLPSISINVTVVLSVVKPNGGICTVGKPGGM